MENEILQLGGVFILGYAILELLKAVILPIVNKFVKNGNGVKEQLQVISENHLHSIEQAIREQTKDIGEWHTKQMEVLTEIRTILSERKP